MNVLPVPDSTMIWAQLTWKSERVDIALVGTVTLAGVPMLHVHTPGPPGAQGRTRLVAVSELACLEPLSGQAALAAERGAHVPRGEEGEDDELPPSYDELQADLTATASQLAHARDEQAKLATRLERLQPRLAAAAQLAEDLAACGKPTDLPMGRWNALLVNLEALLDPDGPSAERRQRMVKVVAGDDDASAEPAPLAAEYAWLVEDRGARPTPLWLTSHPVNGWGWSPDANEAVRFARKVDAERAGLAVDPGRYGSQHLAVQHGWAPLRVEQPSVLAELGLSPQRISTPDERLQGLSWKPGTDPRPDPSP